MEFASGTDPLARSSSVLDVTMEAGSLTVCLPAPSYDVSGLAWMLETSVDLQTWLNAGPLAPESRPGGPVMGASIPAGVPMRYARVRVAFK